MTAYPHPLGAHLSIAGGLDRAFVRAEAIGCTALQIFTKNAGQWRGKAIDDTAAQAFRAAWEKSGIGPVLAHAGYLINLAAPAAELWEKSKAALRDEIQRCARLGIPWLVIHPGSHRGQGAEAGLARVVAALKEILPDSPAEVGVLLENTAAQGDYLGGRFEHLAEILARLPHGRLGVCFDTCHAFAAGYDLAGAEGYRQVMAEFDRCVGVDSIRAFHLNDSMKNLGSRVDRHEQIGRGAIGRAGFAALMTDARFTAIPKILETPKGEDDAWDRINLALLRQLAQGH